MSLAEEKHALRKEMCTRLSIYSKEFLQKGAESALRKLELDTAFVEAQVVLMYWSMADEIDTHQFIDKWSKVKTILLPVIDKETNTFDAFVYEGIYKMERGAFGIQQPKTYKFEGDINLAVVPGRAFDHNGHRLGRGKGFYDIYLKSFEGYTIGLCFNFQLQDYIPFEPFDIVVDDVIASDVSPHLF
ncbi:MAG: 5-formyltetrahydrofolate cyclo-ligase [Bacteroidales bacterium]|jgi:5-formyltetrahydrofolate cyclo-ligase|nr:5-formyltetrahydrofolate cyclo-ligase [Bacteroidales bacterium]